MRKRIRYSVIPYGEWIRPRLRNFREQCCDCGLIHRLDFRVVDARAAARGGRGRITRSSRRSPVAYIEFRTRRDDRATAAARRSFKFTADE
jgi:hypothetical protein